MANLTTRDAKLIQYLAEAYGKEKQLETALQAHIGMTSRAPYRRRLEAHLTETRRHARDVARRIKALGGPAGQAIPVPEALSERVSEAALRVLGGTQKGIALAQGPIHALRGTSEAEKQLKNAKDEYSDEAQEIATYTAIESLADLVGDRDTKQLARSIRREEERMASFLEREIPRLVRAVAQAEIPAAERRRPGRRPTSPRTSADRSATARSASGRSTSSRSASSRSTTRRSTS
jgi:ferritin-like metal-binding protein YciE